MLTYCLYICAHRQAHLDHLWKSPVFASYPLAIAVLGWPSLLMVVLGTRGVLNSNRLRTQRSYYSKAHNAWVHSACSRIQLASPKVGRRLVSLDVLPPWTTFLRRSICPCPLFERFHGHKSQARKEEKSLWFVLARYGWIACVLLLSEVQWLCWEDPLSSKVCCHTWIVSMLSWLSMAMLKLWKKLLPFCQWFDSLILIL